MCCANNFDKHKRKSDYYNCCVHLINVVDSRDLEEPFSTLFLLLYYIVQCSALIISYKLQYIIDISLIDSIIQFNKLVLIEYRI